MAIIDDIPGIEVVVEIDGQVAAEYDNPHADQEPPIDQERPHLVKYIEVKPGATFAVRTVRYPGFQRLGNFIAWKFSVDGNGSLLYSDEQADQQDVYTTCISTIRTNSQMHGWQDHSLRFADLEVVEGAKVTYQDWVRGQACGSIHVYLYHMLGFGKRLEPLGAAPPTETSLLPEKALKGKALSAIAKYEASESTAPRRRERKYHDPESRPFATFEFRYRTKENLMQEAVIPRPTIEERVRDMSDAEAREVLLRELADSNRKENERLERLLREKQQQAAAAEARKRGPVQYKERLLDGGKVEVDLTD